MSFLIIYFVLSFCLFENVKTSSNKGSSDAQCFHFLSAENGIIKTPNYPDVYPASLTCVWTITVDQAYYVELTFHDFDIEDYNKCRADVLEIKDGGAKDSPLIGGQYCNSNKPPSIVTSSDNQLRLWFLSDKTKHYRGFNVSYRAVKDQACGGIITKSHGAIMTPRYPLLYPCNRKCEWTLQAPDKKYVVLEFNFFELQRTCTDKDNCICSDKLIVENEDYVQTYCNKMPPAVMSIGNKLKLTFTSDIYDRFRGFHANFTHSSTPDCGKDVYADSGIIQSPYFYEDLNIAYPPYLYCIWRIITDKSKYLSLKLLYFDIPANEKGLCVNEYLEVRDGPDVQSRPFGFYCNTFYNNVTVSSGNQLYLSFHSGYAKKKGHGFQVQFQSHSKDCHSSIGIEDGRIRNYQLLASSMLKTKTFPGNFHPMYGRLHGSKAWCSQVRPTNIDGEYFAVYLREKMYITKLVMQGFVLNEEDYYITAYSVEYEKDEQYNIPYVSKIDQPHQRKYSVFQGNVNSHSLSETRFDPPIVTKKFYIIPRRFKHGKIRTICMRLELYGCKNEDAP